MAIDLKVNGAQTDFRFFIFYFNKHELGSNSYYISLLQSGPWF